MKASLSKPLIQRQRKLVAEDPKLKPKAQSSLSNKTSRLGAGSSSKASKPINAKVQQQNKKPPHALFNKPLSFYANQPQTQPQTQPSHDADKSNDIANALTDSEQVHGEKSNNKVTQELEDDISEEKENFITVHSLSRAKINPNTNEDDKFNSNKLRPMEPTTTRRTSGRLRVSSVNSTTTTTTTSTKITRSRTLRSSTAIQQQDSNESTSKRKEAFVMDESNNIDSGPKRTRRQSATVQEIEPVVPMDTAECVRNEADGMILDSKGSDQEEKCTVAVETVEVDEKVDDEDHKQFHHDTEDEEDGIEDGGDGANKDEDEGEGEYESESEGENENGRKGEDQVEESQYENEDGGDFETRNEEEAEKGHDNEGGLYVDLSPRAGKSENYLENENSDEEIQDEPQSDYEFRATYSEQNHAPQQMTLSEKILSGKRMLQKYFSMLEELNRGETSRDVWFLFVHEDKDDFFFLLLMFLELNSYRTGVKVHIIIILFLAILIL
jgi:hypothetical protein